MTVPPSRPSVPAMAEVALFSASLAPHGVRPIFFSGCPVACAQAQTAIKGISVYPIDKNVKPEDFDVDLWRSGLAAAAVESLPNASTEPFTPVGPFRAVITLRDGNRAARKIARRWGLEHKGDQVFLDSGNIHDLYAGLIRLCYFTPLTERMLPLALFLYNLWSRVGLEWVRRWARCETGLF